MGEDTPGLLAELKTLRKGRGINSPAVLDQLSGLRTVSGVLPGDAAGAARKKIIDRLGRIIEDLPPDLALAAAAALALHPEARQPFLIQRTEWLSEKIERDTRTARRRMNEALALLAGQAGSQVEARSAAAVAPTQTHHLEQLNVLIRLDRPRPEAHERRLIVAAQDGLTEVDAMLTLPRDPTSREPHQEPDFEVLYGVTEIGRERDTNSRLRVRLRLPRRLRAGEKHEYALMFRVPLKQPIRDHYVLSSYRRCDLFELCIRFDPERLPERIWPVTGGYPRDVDDLGSGPEVGLDGVGELHLDFRTLAIGRMYGAKWQLGPAYQLDVLPVQIG